MRLPRLIALLVLAGVGLIVVVWIQQRPAERQVTEVWQSFLGEVRGNAGDVLEVATMTAEETFERRDRRYTWWGLYLGENTTRIRVPVTFRYHILLSDPWELTIREGVAHVRAPVLRPSNPPAIQTRGIERYNERGWLRFDHEQQMADMERDLTDHLAIRGADARHIARVRDEARGSIAQFVEQWIIEADFRDEVGAIVVVFADEDAATPAPRLLLN